MNLPLFLLVIFGLIALILILIKINRLITKGLTTETKLRGLYIRRLRKDRKAKWVLPKSLMYLLMYLLRRELHLTKFKDYHNVYMEIDSK